ncbi:MAG: WD40/YVTN/BNR-like repeat-containing protein [Planctomycetota bacterium]
MKPRLLMLVGLAGLAGLAGLLCLPACSTSAQLQPPPPRPDGDDLREERKEGVAHPHGASFRWNQRRSANGTVPVNAIARMKEQRDQLLAAQPELPNPLLSNWRWLGPGNIGGRIRAIAIHPTKPNTMWIGSVAGGIWKTTNGGASWFPLDDFAPVMSVSDLDIDPKNPDKIYAATGEAGFFDSVSGSSILAAVRGAGIFVTTNGGTTWSQLASTKGTDFQLVNRLAISPTDNKVLLAATPKGIFHSTDAGASWSKRSTVATMDIDFHPTDGKQAIAGSRDGMPRYSTDAGITWKNATGITTRQRVEVAYAPGNPTTVYAAVSQSDRIHVYRSTNGGQSYTARYTGTLIQTYSRYNNVIWVDPADTNTLLVGGVRLYRSINGGSSWQNAYSGSYYDYHVVVSHPGYNGTTNQTVFHGNDGGIYRTTAFKAATLRWQELNNNLGITQFYGAAISPSGRVLGGTQDNGTLLYTGNKEGWTRPIGADGCFCAADPTDSRYLYGQIYWIRIYRSTNGGNSFRQIANSNTIRDKGSNFIPYIVLDPNNPNRMYFAGASVWRSDNIKTASTPTWTEIKTAISPCKGHGGHGAGNANAHFREDPHCNVSTIAPAKGNQNLVWVGHNHGDIYMTTNAQAATPSWTKVDKSPMPDRWVSRIVIDGGDHKRVYVSFMGYHPDNVWRTTDAGKTWTRITGAGTGALPSAPVSALAAHPTLPGCLFAGTDVGLFYSTDDGQTWMTTKDGSKTSPIDELIWKNSRTLLVVTHGRGIYTVDVGEAATAAVVGTGCGTTNKPALSSSPPVIGTTMGMAMTSAPANAVVWLMLMPGAPTAKNLGNGCTAYVGLGPNTFFVPVGNTNALGSWTTTIKIPPLKSLLGFDMTAQNVIFVSGGPALGIGELSNGIKLHAGL